jgi:uncharacterized iron-regulated protein
MKKIILIIILSFLQIILFAQKPAYKLFDKNNKETEYNKLLVSAKNADIVLFGELHNNPICHWLQLELTIDLFEDKKNNLILGAEMFEADKQIILDEYLNNWITDKHFKDEGKPWTNYDTDYKPLVDFAKKNQLKFIATNIPRRYASIVSKKGAEGLEPLSAEAKKWIAPMPIEFDLTLPAYSNMRNMMGKEISDNFLKAQAIKDATMAHFILKNWEKGKCFLHYNGAYHSDNFESIVWYLKKQNPNLKIVTISTSEQKNIQNVEKDNQNKADFMIVTPINMTKTY